MAKQQADTAQTQYAAAQAQRDAAQAQLDLLVAGETKEALDVARAEVERTRGLVEQAEAALEDTVIRAPQAGVVAEIIAEVGEVVGVGLPIIKLLDLQRPWLKVYVPLPYLDRVKLNQPATITTDAASGAVGNGRRAVPPKTYRGHVVEVSQTPEFTPKNIQTREQRVQLVFWVKIAIENPQGELKPGMPADAVIETG
jgi:HlyD family secretion protein